MTERIARVEAIRVAGQRDYQATAGLRAPELPAPSALALDHNQGRHLCVYPTRAETLLVKITTASGIVGWGEAHSPPAPRVSQALIEDLFAPQLIGKDALAIEARWDELYASMRLRGHISGFMLEARGGVDIALWDIAGKALGQPIYKLLGGPFAAYELPSPHERQLEDLPEPPAAQADRLRLPSRPPAARNRDNEAPLAREGGLGNRRLRAVAAGDSGEPKLPHMPPASSPEERGESNLRAPCYASGVPGSTLDERLAAAEAYIARGFTAMKLSIGRGSLADDLVQAQAVAERIHGRADLLVDAHGCYAARSAIPAAQAREAAGVRWLEDPLPPEDTAGYATLCAAVAMPIASGETECTRWQFHDKLARRAADVILPDICRAGGISEGRKIAWLADLYNTPWCAHASIGSWVHLAAALHLAVATPNFLLCEYPNPLAPNPLGDDLLTAPLRYEAGHLVIPDGPGLGITFDEAALEAHRVG